MEELVEYGLPVMVPKSIAEAKGKVISQGAEAILFKIPDLEQVVKFRPSKPWRLQELDEQLRTRRTNQESRVIKKLKEASIGVPDVLRTDAKNGIIVMEFVPGESLKQATWACEGNLNDEVRGLYRQLGTAVAKMHCEGVMHGDLTTSNVMIDNSKQIRLIDFGLSKQMATAEDKAVDLYVLERAIASTHPLEVEEIVNEVLMPTYISTATELGENVKLLKDKLEKTRAGGRKRTQIG